MINTYSFRNLLRFYMLAMTLIIFSMPSSAAVAPSSVPVPAGKAATAPLSTMNVEDFLSLTPKKYKELTGEKMSLSQKVSLKIAQHKMKKAIRNNKTIDMNQMSSGVDTSDFNIGGFVLGLLLSVVGVLIAYLIGDSSVIKWAWIGFGIVAIIFLLTLIF